MSLSSPGLLSVCYYLQRVIAVKQPSLPRVRLLVSPSRASREKELHLHAPNPSIHNLPQQVDATPTIQTLHSLCLRLGELSILRTASSPCSKWSFATTLHSPMALFQTSPVRGLPKQCRDRTYSPGFRPHYSLVDIDPRLITERQTTYTQVESILYVCDA